MNVHLIDGTYELFRMHFGAPPSKGPDGVEVGASRALLRSLAALVRKPEVSHVGVAFDHKILSFRNELFDGYKTGEGTPDELLAQFPLAEWVASALGCTVWPMMDFEADDGLATAAARLETMDEVEQIFICSPDKDMAQCVRDDRVVLFDRRKDIILGDAGVREKFGVAPTSIPDYLALVGDSADGIPGIPRWGAKSTASVLAHYLDLDTIPDDETEWAVKVRGAASLAKNLRESREDARLYRRLATLRTDAPIEVELDVLKWSGPTADLDAVCQAVGDTREALRL